MTLYEPPPGTPTDENAVTLLKNRFPEFWHECEDDDGSYIVYADFARWLIKKIHSARSDDQINKAFAFLEELLDKGGADIENLIALSTAEVLADELENIDEYPIGPKLSALIKED
ncbi:MAG: hypothetical protein AAFP70_18135 [Calditrichota bacterium]